MIKIKGDIFAGEWDGMVHCANLYNVMGGGIAKQVRSKFPEAYQADSKVSNPQLGSFSHASVCICTELNIETQIFNLYGQVGIGNNGHPVDRNVRYDAFHDGMWAICEYILGLDKSNYCSNYALGYILAIPHGMGCGLAGGEWSIVEPILAFVESQFPEITFAIYEL